MLSLCLSLTAGPGCASRAKPKPTDLPARFQTGPKSQPKRSPKPVAPGNTRTTPPARPSPNPGAQVEADSGRVAWVNNALRFVVLDFSLRSLPPLDKRLSVYRGGRKIGEVKVTGPSRDNNIAADLISGQADVGDEVRAD